MRSVAVVPAAGSAERFGGKKLLAVVDGQALLDRTLAALLEGGVDQIIVVVAPDADDLKHDVRAFGDRRVRSVVNADPARGMFSSLQAGMAEADGEALLVLPADMPYVQPATVRLLLQAFATQSAIVSPRYNGKRGHPVILPPHLRDEIRAAEPDLTLHDILRRHPDERVDIAVDDRGVVRDVDRPADLEA